MIAGLQLRSIRIPTVLPVLLCLLGAGCETTYSLELDPLSDPVISHSVASPGLATKRLERVSVVPHSGDAGSSFDPGRAKIHLALMSRGVQPVDPAISVRASRAGGRPSTTEASAREHTSDLEALIIMAEKSGIDAILRFDPPKIESRPPGTGSKNLPVERDGSVRYFLARKGTRLEEVSRAEYAQGIADKKAGRWFSAGTLRFEGDVLDVPTTDVLAQFDVEIPMVGLASPYRLKFKKSGKIVSRTYEWSAESNAVLLREKALETFYDHFVEFLTSSGATRPAP